MGQLMHGILASVNEYRSNSDGADIRFKMGQKAKAGGTVTRAKIGYLNVAERADDHEFRSVAIDEVRAPFIRLAFELAATGDYTMKRLAAELADRGLRMRSRVDRPAAPITANHLTIVLRDRYYVGVVTYQGEEYPGRHEPLVSVELFEQVQRVLDSRLPKIGERQRKHTHYLKSALWCQRCHDGGRESRLVLMRGRGNGGDYWYFVCSARIHGECDAPYVRAEDVEQGVIRRYATLRLPAEFAAKVRGGLDDALSDEVNSAKLAHANLEKALRVLDSKEQNLLTLAEDGGLVASKVRARLVEIASERHRLKVELAEQAPRLEAGAALIRAAVDLLESPQELYRQATDPVRRQLNQVFFGKLYVDAEEVVSDVLLEPFDGLLFDRHRRLPAAYKRSRAPQTTNGVPKDAVRRFCTSTALFERISRDDGSNKAVMVGDTGIEPVTPTVSTFSRRG